MKVKTKVAITGALLAAVAVGVSTTSSTADAGGHKKEKCFGISKKGQNACGTAEHPLIK